MASSDAAPIEGDCTQGGNSLSERDLEKQRNAIDAAMFYALVRRDVEESKWDSKLKPDHTTLVSNDPGLGVLESPNGVGGYRNRHLGRRSADMVVTCGSARAVWLWKHWVDLAHSNCIFAGSDVIRKRFSAVYRTCLEQNPGDLLRVQAHAEATRFSIRLGEHKLPIETIRCYQGLLKKDGECTYHASSSLADLFHQIIKTVFYASVEYSRHPFSLGEGRFMQRLIPTIVTNANICSCEYGKGDLTAGSEPKNAVVYDVPVDMSATFPNHIAAVDKPMYGNAMWSILVVNRKGLKDLLEGSYVTRTSQAFTPAYAYV